jgi:hypothetical protein
MKGFSIMTFGTSVGNVTLDGVLRKTFFKLYE